MEAPEVRWRLKEVLNREGVSAYALAKALAGKVAPNTVYALARGQTKRPDLEALAWVIWALRGLTGKEYGVGDLLEYRPPS
ncbi:hypothetical protein Theos_1686 [Thermus oshimai JL-2]|uniref:HTH cro/C1-type domain-containing protein n=1 Tax=Thermus oshimai JL-2 TaxID=751945 RepID=K7R0B7_THEOS|nr:hypothetical protein Theos_1686 [Thermus oshimai JL-2]